MTYLVWKLLSWPKVSVTIPALLTGAVLAMVVAHIGNSFQAQAMMNDVIFYGAGVCSAKQIHAKLSHFKQYFPSEYPWVLTTGLNFTQIFDDFLEILVQGNKAVYGSDKSEYLNWHKNTSNPRNFYFLTFSV